MENKYNWTILKRPYFAKRNAPTALTGATRSFIIREIDLRSFGMSIKRNEQMCFCGSGEPVHKCHNAVKENTAMSYLFETFRKIDSDIQNALATPECKSGCTDCCFDCFEVSACEYLAILMYLQKKHTGLFTSSIRKAEKVAKSLRPMFPEYSPWSALSGHRTSAPCIFLDNRNSACRIYEVRPLVCRLYGSYSPYGNCITAKNQLKIIPDDVSNAASQFLGDTYGLGETHPPMAAPLVYWFGGNHPIPSRQNFKELFLAANDGTMNDYVRLSIHLDFDSWFAI